VGQNTGSATTLVDNLRRRWRAPPSGEYYKARVQRREPPIACSSPARRARGHRRVHSLPRRMRSLNQLLDTCTIEIRRRHSCMYLRDQHLRSYNDWIHPALEHSPQCLLLNPCKATVHDEHQARNDPQNQVVGQFRYECPTKLQFVAGNDKLIKAYRTSNW